MPNRAGVGSGNVNPGDVMRFGLSIAALPALLATAFEAAADQELASQLVGAWKRFE